MLVLAQVSARHKVACIRMIVLAKRVMHTYDGRHRKARSVDKPRWSLLRSERFCSSWRANAKTTHEQGLTNASCLGDEDVEVCMSCPSSLLLAPSGDAQLWHVPLRVHHDLSIGKGARKRQHNHSKRAGRVQTDTKEPSHDFL